MKSNQVRHLTIAAVCVALCCVLPQALPQPINKSISPIHIPVLLCGLICGGGWGAVCGVVGPVLASLLFGKPPMDALICMIPELMVYGLSGGFAMKCIRTGKTTADLYISLTIAMLAGRIAGGIANVIFYAVTSGVYSVALWLTSYFVNAVPGIIVHLLLIPVLVLTLMKAKLLPARYPK